MICNDCYFGSCKFFDDDIFVRILMGCCVCCDNDLANISDVADKILWDDPNLRDF